MKKTTKHHYTEEEFKTLYNFLKSGEKTIMEIKDKFKFNDWHKAVDFVNSATNRILIYEDYRKAKVYYGLYE